MPLYAYHCKKCGNEFEAYKPVSEYKRAKCPDCNTWAEKIFSPVPIIFKGSGFYCTDNKKSGVVGAKPSTPEKPAETKTDAASESKSETRSESKPESKSGVAESKPEPKTRESVAATA